MRSKRGYLILSILLILFTSGCVQPEKVTPEQPVERINTSLEIQEAVSNTTNDEINVERDEPNITSNEVNDSGQTETSPEMRPVLKNLGVKIEPWDKTTKRAGDFLFERKNYVDNKIFTEFAHRIVNDMGEKLLPEIGFNVPVGTKVVSPIDGVITEVKLYGPSQDYILFIKTDESSPWIVGFEHVYHVRIKAGDTVVAGQELAEVSPSYGRTEFGNVEINVWTGGQQIVKYCPFEFLEESLKTRYEEKINRLASDWEEFVGENVYQQEKWVAPGCLLHNMTER